MWIRNCILSVSEYFLASQEAPCKEISLCHRPIEERDFFEIVLEHVEKNGDDLRFASERLRNDEKVVMAAVRQKGSSLRYASDRLRNDMDVIKVAIGRDIWALNWVSDSIKNDAEFAKMAVSICPDFLEKFPEHIRDNREVVMRAAHSMFVGYNFACISERLRDDKELVRIALTNHRVDIRSMSSRLKDDEEIILEAVSSNWKRMKHASYRLADDERFVREAMSWDSRVAKYASERLKDDKDFMLFVVGENWKCIEYASERLKDDEDFMLSAAQLCRHNQANKFLIVCASERLKDDDDFVYSYIFENGGPAIKYASDRLKIKLENRVSSSDDDDYHEYHTINTMFMN